MSCNAHRHTARTIIEGGNETTCSEQEVRGATPSDPLRVAE